MNRLSTLSIAAMFVAGAALTLPTMVHAQYGGSNPGTTNPQGGTGMEQGSQGATGSEHQAMMHHEGQEQGEHQMTGTISSINHDKGTVDVKTAEETLKLHFPPQAIRDLKQGDRITVQLGFFKPGSTQGSAGDSPSHSGDYPNR